MPTLAERIQVEADALIKGDPPRAARLRAIAKAVAGLELWANTATDEGMKPVEVTDIKTADIIPFCQALKGKVA